jgi:hypothetical protein
MKAGPATAARTVADADRRCRPRRFGCDARARPHRDGYQVILNQAAGERLIRVFDPTGTGL